MSVIAVQQAVATASSPPPERLRQWAKHVLAHQQIVNVEWTVRIVDLQESAALNQRYRGHAKPTNVLSFSMPSLSGFELPALGDIVICAALVERESQEQGKPLESHWAHMVIHGALHLLGYDHKTEAEAQHMEWLEATLMDGLGFTNPYEVTQ